VERVIKLEKVRITCVITTAISVKIRIKNWSEKRRTKGKWIQKNIDWRGWWWGGIGRAENCAIIT